MTMNTSNLHKFSIVIWLLYLSSTVLPCCLSESPKFHKNCHVTLESTFDSQVISNLLLASRIDISSNRKWLITSHQDFSTMYKHSLSSGNDTVWLFIHWSIPVICMSITHIFMFLQTANINLVGMWFFNMSNQFHLWLYYSTGCVTSRHI